MPAFTSKLSDKEYTKILQDEDFGPASYKEVADAFMKNGIKQMYHAMVNEDDILTIFKIEHLKIFWICRCHHVADDGSTSHEHLHALVQYQNKKTHEAFKHRLRRAGQRLHKKTTFKKILCPDHALGVLRYICCRDGQRVTRRDGDGLMGAPHTHYRRSVFQQSLLHKRNTKPILGCRAKRLSILRGIKNHLTEDWMNGNVSGNHHNLHHHETCLCDFGKIGKEKKEAANKKRSDFYKTERGLAMRQKHKDRANEKKDIVALIKDLDCTSNLAEMQKETIIQLFGRMK